MHNVAQLYTHPSQRLEQIRQRLDARSPDELCVWTGGDAYSVEYENKSALKGRSYGVVAEIPTQPLDGFGEEVIACLPLDCSGEGDYDVYNRRQWANVLFYKNAPRDMRYLLARVAALEERLRLAEHTLSVCYDIAQREDAAEFQHEREQRALNPGTVVTYTDQSLMKEIEELALRLAPREVETRFWYWTSHHGNLNPSGWYACITIEDADCGDDAEFYGERGVPRIEALEIPLRQALTKAMEANP